VFVASFGLCIHKNQISLWLVYEINGLGFIGFLLCHRSLGWIIL
jgi:hypothetical protein